MFDVFSSVEFWTAVVVALLSGGGIGAQACDILTDKVIAPLREQLDEQEEQIEHLEKSQRKYFALAAYTRQLFHWLGEFCEVTDPDFLVRQPKPSLPDELRADIAPETLTHKYSD